MIEGSIIPASDKKSNESIKGIKNNLTVWLELWSNFTDDGEQFKMVKNNNNFCTRKFQTENNDYNFFDSKNVLIFLYFYFLQNVSDTWVVPSLPSELVDVFPSQRRQHRFLLKSVNER